MGSQGRVDLQQPKAQPRKNLGTCLQHRASIEAGTFSYRFQETWPCASPISHALTCIREMNKIHEGIRIQESSAQREFYVTRHWLQCLVCAPADPGSIRPCPSRRSRARARTAVAVERARRICSRWRTGAEVMGYRVVASKRSQMRACTDFAHLRF